MCHPVWPLECSSKRGCPGLVCMECACQTGTHDFLVEGHVSAGHFALYTPQSFGPREWLSIGLNRSLCHDDAPGSLPLISQTLHDPETLSEGVICSPFVFRGPDVRPTAACRRIALPFLRFISGRCWRLRCLEAMWDYAVTACGWFFARQSGQALFERRKAFTLCGDAPRFHSLLGNRLARRTLMLVV